MTPSQEENFLEDPIIYSEELADLAMYVERDNDVYANFFQQELKNLSQIELDAFLIHYVEINHFDMIKILLELGANPNRKYNTLSKSLYTCTHDALKLLLKYGGNLDTINYDSIFFVRKILYTYFLDTIDPMNLKIITDYGLNKYRCMMGLDMYLNTLVGLPILVSRDVFMNVDLLCHTTTPPEILNEFTNVI